MKIINLLLKFSGITIAHFSLNGMYPWIRFRRILDLKAEGELIFALCYKKPGVKTPAW